MDFVAYAQVAAALATVFLAGVALAQVLEMRAARIEQQRPHVIVDADYSNPSVTRVVVRNIGAGSAQNIKFHFSHPLESSLRDPNDPSKNFVLSELPYFREGIDYLAPGSEIGSAWGPFRELLNLLAAKGLQDGITVTSHYQDLGERDYHTSWKLNPLDIEGVMEISSSKKGVHELVKTLEALVKTLNKVVDPSQGELRVATDAERRKRRDADAGGQYKHMDQVEVKRGENQVLNGQVDRYLGGGLYWVFVAGQGPQRIAERDLSPRRPEE